MHALRTETLERRNLSAADLIAAPAFMAESAPTESEAVVVGKFCNAQAINLPLVMEKVSTSNQNLDVDRDGIITRDDANLILSDIGNPWSIGPMPIQDAEGEPPTTPPVQSYDVNSDGVVSAADVLAVVNRLNFYNQLVPCNCTSCLASDIVEGV